MRPSKSHGTLIQIAQSSAPDDVAKHRLRPSNLDDLLAMTAAAPDAGLYRRATAAALVLGPALLLLDNLIHPKEYERDNEARSCPRSRSTTSAGSSRTRSGSSRSWCSRPRCSASRSWCGAGSRAWAWWPAPWGSWG